MSFFDKMSDTLSSKSKELTQKAKDVAKVTSLNGQIRDIEETVNRIYLKLGKAYYERHQEEVDHKYADEFAKIKENMDKIKALKHEIQEIKGEQACPYCGETIDSESVFCPKCGKKMIEE